MSHRVIVGRARESARVRELLGRTALLTLTGTGGAGKTQLARRVMQDVARAWPDGVHFVGLGDLRDPSLVTATVADALGLRNSSDSTNEALLLGYLRDRKLLLVVDNCEHVLDEAARVVNEMLSTAPGVTVLATSRQSLGIAGEQVFAVPPLRIPHEGAPLDSLREYDAVQLFLERAAAVVPTAELGPDELADVVRLCRQLDGLPLAIELAAARLRVLAPGQIVERLDRGLAMLGQGPRTAPDRHRTMRAAIDGSHELCTDLERTVWARASVFAGSFDLDAAEHVCAGGDVDEADVVLALDGLVDKSILIRQEHDQKVRFRLLEVLREYGHERLVDAGEAEAVARRHRDWYDGITVDADREWFSAAQGDWTRRLSTERANLRAALDWSITSSGEPDRTLAMATRVTEFLCVRGYPREAREWVDRALGACPPEVPGRARALGVSGFAAVFHGDPALALERVAEAERLDDPEAVPYLAHVRAFTGLLLLSPAAREARTAVDEFTARGDLRRAMHPMFLLGLLEAMEGAPEAGRETLAEMVRICTPVGEANYLAMARFGQAVLEVWWFQDADAADQPARDAVRLDRQAESRLGLAYHLDALAWVAVGQGDPERAARLFGAALRLWEAFGVNPEVSLAVTHAHFVAAARSALGDAAYERHLLAGKALATEDAVAWALGEDTAEVPTATPSALTRREDEIAALVAEGLTNRQVAERLVIAVRTVDTHVQNILTKLDLSNRTQIAAWVTARRKASAGPT